MDPPWRNITALLHEGSQREPKAVEDAKVVGGVRGGLGVFCLILLVKIPLIWAEPANQEQNHAHTNVGKHDAHPDLVGQGVQEGKHPRFGLLGLLDHDGDAQTHEGLGEVYHLLSHQGDGEGCNSYICSLETGTCKAHVYFIAVTSKNMLSSCTLVSLQRSVNLQLLGEIHICGTTLLS